MTTFAALTITLFGPMQVRVQGQPMPPQRSRTMLWLLALLTLRHNRPVEREWLAGTLWPDRDQSQAFANLRPLLSELRSALGGEGDRLQSPSRRTLVLDLTDANVDVLAFDAAMASGIMSRLEQAVGLYRGPLLEGCSEEWVFQERSAREQNCLHALQKLGDTALRGGDYEQAGRCYQRMVGMDPWQEAARRGWMEALARRGDINAALQVYREFVVFLKDDPKAVPDEQTSALYQRLRAEVRQKASPHAEVIATETVVPKVVGYLPHPLTELVGREDERLEVGICLRRSRLVTLIGPGGIGKTRLAREVASEVVKEYADGVWLVALETLSESRLVTQQVASVLGLKEQTGQPLIESVTEHLRQKRLLLVLDNCEHLLEASAQVVGHLLQECAEVRILATSREALGITGETIWSVPALAVPDLAHLPQGPTTLVRVLQGYESVQLFVERAQAVQKGFALSGHNARLVAQACRQLEGIPLAIELAAARVKAMSVEQITLRLEDRLGLLTTGSRAAQTRQQTLRSTLDWSYDLLTEAERTLLRRLSVFAGGWTLEAAEQVCAGEGVAAGQVLDLLTSLVDKSLVLFEEREAAERRYRLLEMVRQYAAESLQESAEAEQVKTRHRDWFLALAEAAEPQLQGAEQETWLQQLETEHANLRAALAWSATDVFGAPAGLRLAGALCWFWFVRGYWSAGREHLQAALSQESAGQRTPARAKALSGAGSLAFKLGDYAAARNLNEESLAIRKELGDKKGIASSLNNLGLVASNQGNYASALALYEEALGINKEMGNRAWEAINLSNLGTVSTSRGDNEAAKALYEASLAIKRELGDRYGIANSLHELGSVALGQSDYGLARTLLLESLAIRKELGDKSGIASSLQDLGSVAQGQGDYAAARALYVESLEISRELGEKFDIACLLEDIAGLAGQQGQFGRAVRLLGAAEMLCVALGRTQPLGITARHERTVTAAHAVLGEEAFAAAWEEGRAMTLEQAVEFAFAETPC